LQQALPRNLVHLQSLVIREKTINFGQA